MKTLLFIGSISLFLTACGGAANTPNANSNANVNKAANTNTAANTNAANTAANTNANAAPPADSGPKRLTFNKGTSNTVESFTLAPGESKKFVIGAKSGQNIVIDNGGDGSKITMLTKGKTVDETNEKGRYDGTTVKAGDFIFEISNPGKAPLKASINVMIENIGDE